MKSYHLIVGLGAVVGVIGGSAVWHTDPAFLGWVFGLGMGLLGGAFVAAIASGTALAGAGPKRTRREREWLMRGDEDEK
ncbi:MAG: hypothetical protein EPO65_01420 [Dehalococcoidia bacterium]|nr:MAG: hypothetical protein EPO65_01420 [Dehalococcoidia bacterium]